MNIWTDERIETLKRLRARGLSCSAIAAVMGGGVTRNAVIGKLQRLGLCKSKSRSPSPPLTPGQARRTPSMPKTAGTKPPGRALALTAPPPLENVVTILTLTDRTCRWPIGEPHAPEFHFCGHEPVQGKHYCPFHEDLKVDHTTPRRSERRAA